jgi:Zn-dependent peptidase ImmA (M78 family)
LIPLYFKMKSNGVPLLSNRDIELDAVAILKDFDPNLLTTPTHVDIERFTESYMGLNLDFNWLSHNQTLLGRMIFQNTIIPVYNPTAERAEDFPAQANTVMVDNSLVESDTLLRSTIAHECGHAVYHRSYYERQAKGLPTAACTTRDILHQDSIHMLSTDHDWLEHHAKRFGAAILMPYPAVRIVFSDYADHLRLWYRKKTSLCNRLMAERVASMFKVSCGAAKIRLNQLHLGFQPQTNVSPTESTQDSNILTLSSITEDDLARLEAEREKCLFRQYYG